MNEPFQLVTNCTFKGKDYLVQMCVLNSKKLELIVTDKLMAEDWQCEYDVSYIEALTHKTGNFKQFDVFIVMLKSGLLKTSECITLDLLTLEDLEELRSKKNINSYQSSRSCQNPNSNKRYLILTYSVEFDRIHYPLPLDYCGPPNPSVLQSNIRRLEAEVGRLKQKNVTLSKCDDGEIQNLKHKLKILSEDNAFLSNEVRRLNKTLSKRTNPVKSVQVLQGSLKKLEDRVALERNRNQQSMQKLKSENKQLTQHVEELKKREKALKLKLREATRQICHRGSRRVPQTYFNRDNSVEGRIKPPVDREESLLFLTVPNCNSPTTAKPNQSKIGKRSHNRFLSSSSSERGSVKPARGRCREIVQSTLGRQPLRGKASSKSRHASEERSKCSSEESERKIRPGKSSRRSEKNDGSIRHVKGDYRGSQEDLPHVPRTCSRSRDSSLSSKTSSKQSKSSSRTSQRGSGDHKAKGKTYCQGTEETHKEDLKLSVSDLESRIHALQRLLSEGLNF